MPASDGKSRGSVGAQCGLPGEGGAWGAGRLNECTSPVSHFAGTSVIYMNNFTVSRFPLSEMLGEWIIAVVYTARRGGSWDTLSPEKKVMGEMETATFRVDLTPLPWSPSHSLWLVHAVKLDSLFLNTSNFSSFT